MIPADTRPSNVVTLDKVLAGAEAGGYAVGSFAPRSTSLIRYVLRAGASAYSPLIVQMSANEMRWFGVTGAEFAEAFYEAVRTERVAVPVVLHLDHTKDFEIIRQAVEAGFTSVMIDRSEMDLAENIARTKEVVEYAHARGVSVEAELGRIFTGDTIETESDEELYTVPEEAAQFVRQTGVDALAVSVGTAHGIYKTRQPRIDLERLRAIRAAAPVHLVLHGGSGVPPEMIAGAVHLPGGGISKINIATDLEQAFLRALRRTDRMSNAEIAALPPEQLQIGGAAVQSVVVGKMVEYLDSQGRAPGR